MSDRFLSRQLLNLALVANATRPLPGAPTSFPAFFAGWLSSELAPHALALTGVDVGAHLARHGLGGRGSRLGLAAAGVSAAGYASLIAAGTRARHEVEAALVEGLGPDYTGGLSREMVESDLATPWRKLINPFDMKDPTIKVRRRLPYAPGGMRFEADVYHRRDVPTGAPVLLQVHGGGWVIGRKEQQGVPLMTRMASLGWVCVAVNYPLSPKARWPNHLVALKRSIGWIRANIGEYGGDPSFLAVTGGSAGGHLSAMLALTGNDPEFQPGFESVDTSVQACAPHYGVYDFTAEDGTRASRHRLETLVRPLVMARDARYPEDYRGASPLYRIGPDAPPFFVIHGTNDSLVPVSDARAFVAALREVSKSPVAYAEMRGAQHAFDIFPSIRSAHVVRGVERFLDWTYTNASRAEDPESALQQG